MAVSSILGASANTGTTPSSSSALNMTTFMQLLTTQLANQDPLDPMSDGAFFSQLAQMGTVQGVQAIEQTSQVSQAASLMGQTISGISVNPATNVSSNVSGVVTSVSVQNGSYVLQVTSANGVVSPVPVSNITGIIGGQTGS